MPACSRKPGSRAVYSSDSVYDALDTLVSEGRITAYGVSVETCGEALTAIVRPGVSAVIPGARIPGQARSNGPAAELPPLPRAADDADAVYDDLLIRPQVHERW